MSHMELRSGFIDSPINEPFFIVVVLRTGQVYMWEDWTKYIDDPTDGQVLAKWCKWPEEWGPLRRNEICDASVFNKTTGHDFEETVARDIRPVA